MVAADSLRIMAKLPVHAVRPMAGRLVWLVDATASEEVMEQ